MYLISLLPDTAHTSASGTVNERKKILELKITQDITQPETFINH